MHVGRFVCEFAGGEDRTVHLELLRPASSLAVSGVWGGSELSNLLVLLLPG